MAQYYHRPNPKINYPVVAITPAKVLLSIISVMMFFVIPVQLIESGQQSEERQPVYTSQESDTTGRLQGEVAGTSTTNIPALVSSQLQGFGSDRQALTLVGIILVVASMIFALYLLASLAAKPQTHSAPQKVSELLS